MNDRQASIRALIDANKMETAEREARAYADELNKHGFTATVWTFGTALDNYGPESRRTSYAHGYAVRYAGRRVFGNGSLAEYPTAGVTVFCQDGQLALSKLLAASRTLVTFGDGSGDWRSYSPYQPMYVAAWNPRDTELQRDQSVNPGILPTVILHDLTPSIGGDGPKRFYDLRLDPAGDLPTGTRVRVVSGGTDGNITAVPGQLGTIRHPHPVAPMVELDPVYDPVADTTRPWGQLRQIPRANLEPEAG